MAEPEQDAEPTQAEVVESPKQVAPTVIAAPPPTWAASQFTNYTPPLIPHEVWTEKLAEKVIDNWRNMDDKNHSAATDMRRQLHTKTLLGYGFVAAVVVVGIVFIATGLPGGQEILIGALAFVAGFLAGDGNAKAQQR